MGAGAASPVLTLSFVYCSGTPPRCTPLPTASLPNHAGRSAGQLRLPGRRPAGHPGPGHIARGCVFSILERREMAFFFFFFFFVATRARPSQLSGDRACRPAQAGACTPRHPPPCSDYQVCSWQGQNLQCVHEIAPPRAPRLPPQAVTARRDPLTPPRPFLSLSLSLSNRPLQPGRRGCRPVHPPGPGAGPPQAHPEQGTVENGRRVGDWWRGGRRGRRKKSQAAGGRRPGPPAFSPSRSRPPTPFCLSPLLPTGLW